MATHQIEYAGDSDRELWDGYVRKHPDASLYHLFAWRNVIRRTYRHETYYLMLVNCDEAVGGDPSRPDEKRRSVKGILGVLPLVHFQHPLFGNSLVSLPFVDGGGILANSREAEEHLLREVFRLGRKIGAKRVELRYEQPREICDAASLSCNEGSRESLEVATRTDKARMLLRLPDSSDMLMQSFKSKLRSQILKPMKEGLTSKTGGVELLEDFYRVFLINMRDLGSPVHSRKLMMHVLSEFAEQSRIFVVYKLGEPVASALVVGFDKVLRNPWASSLRKYAPLSPNMLLYFCMLEFACDNGYRVFDFGRSTKGEGTYKFKQQWGAVPAQLYWQYFSLGGRLPNPESVGQKKRQAATYLWKKLPIVLTRIIGPSIRKHISL